MNPTVSRFRGRQDGRELESASVDYQIGGHDGAYSIENMLGSRAMVAELDRIQRLLLPSPE